MATRKRLPQELFVTWEEADSDDAFLSVNEAISDFAERGKKRIVGTYKLVREDFVEAVTKISQRKVR